MALNAQFYQLKKALLKKVDPIGVFGQKYHIGKSSKFNGSLHTWSMTCRIIQLRFCSVKKCPINRLPAHIYKLIELIAHELH